jgi:CRISPR-associated protein Csm1
LSFAISLYFEGWVEHLAARINQEDRQADRGERLYSIYSGGDDLFFVGSWDVVVELARQVRADLAPFAAQHPGVHASAGIALVGGKYPLYQAAREAKEAEDQAKGLRWMDGDGRLQEKDAVSFLGQTLPWPRFGLEPCDRRGLENAHALMHLLVDLVDRTDAPRLEKLRL